MNKDCKYCNGTAITEEEIFEKFYKLVKPQITSIMQKKLSDAITNYVKNKELDEVEAIKQFEKENDEINREYIENYYNGFFNLKHMMTSPLFNCPMSHYDD